MAKYDWYTIEPCPSRTSPLAEGGGFVVYGHGTWGPESVLEGRPKRAYLQWFESVEEAQRAYPEARESGNTKGDYAHVELPENPPAWFDPAAAGERWDDDY